MLSSVTAAADCLRPGASWFVCARPCCGVAQRLALSAGGYATAIPITQSAAAGAAATLRFEVSAVFLSTSVCRLRKVVCNQSLQPQFSPQPNESYRILWPAVCMLPALSSCMRAVCLLVTMTHPPSETHRMIARSQVLCGIPVLLLLLGARVDMPTAVVSTRALLTCLVYLVIHPLSEPQAAEVWARNHLYPLTLCRTVSCLYASALIVQTAAASGC